jgi:hypothetical protein
MLLFCLRILDAQTISPTPGFLQDVGGQIPVPEQFSFEPQFQLGMTGAARIQGAGRCIEQRVDGHIRFMDLSSASTTGLRAAR